MSGEHDPGFFPRDSMDGRKTENWETRYPDPEARKAIRCEALYLGFFLVAYLAFLILLLCGTLTDWAGFSVDRSESFTRYVGAFLAGSIGGILYASKWLVHAVAKARWNIDRRLWRYFAPHWSGALGIVVILVVESGLLGFLDRDAVNSTSLVVGLAFLVGYFSDRTIAKLSDLFTSIFGSQDPYDNSGRETK